MSMPSLVISESNTLSDTSKEKNCVSSNYKKNLKSSSHDSGAQRGKKSVTESMSAPSVNTESDGRQQSFYVWRKSERKNRKSERGSDELTKGRKCNESNTPSNVIEKSDQEKTRSHNKGRTHDEPISANISFCTKTGDSENVKTESIEDEKDGNDSLKGFMKNDNLVCNHLCDPSIPEISETSDVEDDENRETNTLKPQLNLPPSIVERDVADSDQQVDPDAQ